MSPFFTIFHRLHHHFPDENPYRCIFHLRAHAEGLTRGCRLGCATSGENGGIFQWRLRWCAKHLTITSFFKCEAMVFQCLTWFDHEKSEESRNWPWFTSGEKKQWFDHQIRVKQMWFIHVANSLRKSTCNWQSMHLSIYRSIYLPIYLVISYRTSYLSLYLSSVSSISSIYLSIYRSIDLSIYPSTVSIPAYSWHFCWTWKWSRRWRNTLLLKFLF